MKTQILYALLFASICATVAAGKVTGLAVVLLAAAFVVAIGNKT